MAACTFSSSLKPSVSPAAPETVHVNVKMQMFDHTWQLSLFPLLRGASLLSERTQLYPAPLQIVRIWGILVTEMSYVFPPGVSCPPRSHAAFPFSHSHFLSCQPGNVLATVKPQRPGKLFPCDRYNNSGKPLPFLFIIHLPLPGTKDGVANQMHKKTNQSFFCWSWFIAWTLLYIEQDELQRDAPDYEMLKRLYR